MEKLLISKLTAIKSIFIYFIIPLGHVNVYQILTKYLAQFIIFSAKKLNIKTNVTIFTHLR